MSSGPEVGVALLGLGNVGAGVMTLLAENAASIEARTGARLVVRSVAVRDVDKPRLVGVHSTLLTTDLVAAARRPDVDVVCELMGGTDAAYAAVMTALDAGKHVVTANKALLAERGAEVFAAASRHNVDLYYEAAVCGGVPVIRMLREGLASDQVENLVGIVNGTSNYILSAMTAAGRDFADVLREAQQLGYAEADPTLDIGGGDAAHKLAILIMLCFGTLIDPNAIAKDGIDSVEAVDIAYARRLGYVIKPLAIARNHDAGIEARVHPALVPSHWLLADVPDAKNALYVHSRALGASMYYGAGAGMLPTAVAVVADLIEIARNQLARVAGAPPLRRQLPLAPRPVVPIADLRSRYYLRFAVADKPGVLGQLTTILGKHHTSIAQVIQEEARSDGAAPPSARVVVVTHESREGDLRAALAEIDALPAVIAPTRVLRIAGGGHGA